MIVAIVIPIHHVGMGLLRDPGMGYVTVMNGITGNDDMMTEVQILLASDVAIATNSISLSQVIMM